MEPPSKKEHARYARARRNLVRSLSALGVASATIGLPSRWQKPIVDSVILPVHGVTSLDTPADDPQPILPPGFRVSIRPEFACNSTVPFGDDVFLLISVSPVPQADRDIGININCDGNQSDLGLTLDSAGTASITINANSFCNSVVPHPDMSTFTELVLTATYEGESVACSWQFETPTAPPP